MRGHLLLLLLQGGGGGRWRNRRRRKCLASDEAKTTHEATNFTNHLPLEFNVVLLSFILNRLPSSLVAHTERERASLAAERS